jgi:hypothetical protein
VLLELQFVAVLLRVPTEREVERRQSKELDTEKGREIDYKIKC